MSATVQQSCTLVPGIPKSDRAPEAGAPAHSGPRSGSASGRSSGRIPKELVHLRDAESVLVTGWVRRGPTEFTLTVEWPASLAAAHPGPVLAAHTVRQCGLAISHAEFGIPLDHQSLLRELNFTIAPTAPAVGNGPLLLTVDLRCAPANGRGVRALGCEAMDFTVRHGERTVIRAQSRTTWISPSVYRRLRGPYLAPAWGAWDVPPPVPPSAVGCAEPADVVLAATGRAGRWELRNDTANKEMFDHPVDHVPGLSLLTAACQAAQAALPLPGSLTATSVTMEFERYVEFDAPCVLEAAVLEAGVPAGVPAGVLEAAEISGAGGSGRTAVGVTGFQRGERAFRIALAG